jgi:hypothetical protein
LRAPPCAVQARRRRGAARRAAAAGRALTFVPLLCMTGTTLVAFADWPVPPYVRAHAAAGACASIATRRIRRRALAAVATITHQRGLRARPPCGLEGAGAPAAVEQQRFVLFDAGQPGDPAVGAAPAPAGFTFYAALHPVHSRTLDARCHRPAADALVHVGRCANLPRRRTVGRGRATHLTQIQKVFDTLESSLRVRRPRSVWPVGDRLWGGTHPCF